MSVAFESTSCSDTNRIQSQGFSRGMWIYNISDPTRFTGANNPWTSRLPAVKEEDDSTSSSSIGKNSDAGGGDSGEDDGDGEVQSKDIGPLDRLNSLEEVLPIKRGLSSFYAGKSKSYSSLADASSVESIQDIVKPENAYSRKRKNMIAHSVIFEKLRKSAVNGGTSKRLANSTSGSHGRLLLPLPPPKNNGRITTDESSDSPSPCFSAWRSLSLSDLEHVSSITESVINERDKEDKH